MLKTLLAGAFTENVTPSVKTIDDLVWLGVSLIDDQYDIVQVPDFLV